MFSEVRRQLTGAAALFVGAKQGPPSWPRRKALHASNTGYL